MLQMQCCWKWHRLLQISTTAYEKDVFLKDTFQAIVWDLLNHWLRHFHLSHQYLVELRWGFTKTPFKLDTIYQWQSFLEMVQTFKQRQTWYFPCLELDSEQNILTEENVLFCYLCLSFVTCIILAYTFNSSPSNAKTPYHLIIINNKSQAIFNTANNIFCYVVFWVKFCITVLNFKLICNFSVILNTIIPLLSLQATLPLWSCFKLPSPSNSFLFTFSSKLKM